MLSVQQLLEQKPKGIYSVQPDDPVITAIRKMAEHHIGALLVMTGDRLVGIVSERDYARKVVLLGRSSTETRVSDIMTPKVITVTPKQDAHDCGNSRCGICHPEKRFGHTLTRQELAAALRLREYQSE